MQTVTEQLRRAVEQSSETRYRIAKETGIQPSVLSRFVASGNGLRSDNFDKLCTYLGLVLVKKARTTRKDR